MLVDTHCHIHDDKYDFSHEEVIERAKQAGVVKLICIGTSFRTSEQAIALASEYDNVFAAVGVHPHDAKYGIDGINELAELDLDKLVAIGEIGLDYYYGNSPRNVQIKILEEQLQIARDNDLPVVFHVRDAFDDFWPVVNNFIGLRGVLHSFTDNIDNLNKATRRDLYIGVNGISTFTKDRQQQEMFMQIPLERLVFETDAPFLTPSPFRGKMNEPSMVSEIAKQYAMKRGVSFTELAKLTTKNAEKLFGI